MSRRSAKLRRSSTPWSPSAVSASSVLNPSTEERRYVDDLDVEGRKRLAEHGHLVDDRRVLVDEDEGLAVERTQPTGADRSWPEALESHLHPHSLRCA